MCGICGIWSGGTVDALRAMVRAMHHRGPDDHGIHSGDRVMLGMARLAILDTSSAGHQPMSNADGSVSIVYNGETYNHRELRRMLESEGQQFSSGTDTEVVLQLYIRHGDDFLKKIRGMFALAISDRRNGRERLLLARDPLGIKPLLYSGNTERLVFASEIKALLASGLVSRKISPAALHGLLAFGSVAQPDTLLEGVKMLPPGHQLVIEQGRMNISSYWSLSTARRPDLARMDYSSQVRELRQVLEDSVRAHMVSDVPVGAFLSGGIDSTVLVALMSQIAGNRIRTFSVGFGDEGAGMDETDAAARTAAFLGTEHLRVHVSGPEVRNRLPDIAAALDQPSVDGANAYFVSAAAAGQVKVAVSGTGGDELFAGYPWFAATAAAEPLLAGKFRRWISGLAAIPLEHAGDGYATRALSRIRAGGDFLELFSRQYRIFGSARARKLLAAPLSITLGLPVSDRQRAAAADELPGSTVVARVSALCLRGYTQNQLLRDIDAVSMAHSLEIRVPFLDPVVTDFALSLPDATKLGNPLAGSAYSSSGAKRILLDATRDLLPPGIGEQPKSGFSMPFATWLRGPLRDIFEETTSTAAVQSRGLFDAAQVARTRQDFQQGRACWALPWTLMMTELWCRGVLDAAPIPDK